MPAPAYKRRAKSLKVGVDIPDSALEALMFRYNIFGFKDMMTQPQVFEKEMQEAVHAFRKQLLADEYAFREAQAKRDSELRKGEFKYSDELKQAEKGRETKAKARAGLDVFQRVKITPPADDAVLAQLLESSGGTQGLGQFLTTAPFLAEQARQANEISHMKFADMPGQIQHQQTMRGLTEKDLQATSEAKMREKFGNALVTFGQGNVPQHVIESGRMLQEDVPLPIKDPKTGAVLGYSTARETKTTQIPASYTPGEQFMKGGQRVGSIPIDAVYDPVNNATAASPMAAPKVAPEKAAEKPKITDQWITNPPTGPLAVGMEAAKGAFEGLKNPMEFYGPKIKSALGGVVDPIKELMNTLYQGNPRMPQKAPQQQQPPSQLGPVYNPVMMNQEEDELEKFRRWLTIPQAWQ